MASSTITEQVESHSLPLANIQQLITTPQRITRSTLTRVNDMESSIECLPGTDPADKCNNLVARKLINIRETELNGTGVLPLSHDHVVEFLNGFQSTPQDDKYLENEAYSKPFPSLKLKNSKVEQIYNFLGIYISSNHDLGKMIYTLSKDMKKLSIQQFDEALADLIFNFQSYLNTYISHLQCVKLDVRKIEGLFNTCCSPDMEAYDKRIVCKTILTTIYNSSDGAQCTALCWFCE